jgi:hypothetical protein
MQALNFNVVRQSLQQWIDVLPLANPIKTSELIYNKLAELPFPHMQPIECFELLEMLKPPIRLLNEVMQKQFSEREVRSIMEYSRQTALIISLLTRYASGYAVLLSSTHTNDKLADGMPLAAMCIHRAIYNLSQVVVISYQLYMAPPNQVWLRIHKLFLQAEKNGYTTMILTQNVNEPSTISDAYKMCILLACANPNQLRAADVIKLYTALLQWARYTEIVSQNPEHAAITFLLDEDAPPSYQVINQRPANSPFLRGLNTKHLIAHISASIKQHDESVITSKTALSQNVLQIIAKAWSNFSQRVMERSPRSGDIQVTLGLTSTHAHIVGDKPFPQFESTSISETFTTLPRESNLDKTDYALDDKQLATEQDSVDILSLSNKNASQDITSKYPIYDWQIINVSPQGYCLQTDSRHVATPFEAGELVGLHQTSQQVGHWRVGAVRWVKKVNHHQFQLGIMILGPSAIPVAIQIAESTSKRYFRALILPELYSAQKANTIIIPAFDLAENDQLFVFYNDHQINIKLTEPIYLNDKFYQFKYEVIEELSLIKTDNANKDDLESIWDYLK